MQYDAIIVGAGPAGLACAARLAQKGVAVLVVERKSEIGPKACAGGITWSGLLRIVPESLIEAAFPCQHVYSRLQRIQVREKNPIIATVSRKRLGQHMADVARQAGADILTSTTLQQIRNDSVILINNKSGQQTEIGFSFLIGADGSSSLVRRHLGIPTEKVGIGVNYQIPGNYEDMTWHLDSGRFANGYGWIFPHKETISIGAYVPSRALPSATLKKNLVTWAKTKGFDLTTLPYSGGLINFDYRGYHFDRFFLIGDAGGFASALTGEGIYPAIVTGESVADIISDGHCDTNALHDLIARQKRFVRMIELTSKNSFLSAILAEIGVFGLRIGLLDFTKLEMSTRKSSAAS